MRLQSQTTPPLATSISALFLLFSFFALSSPGLYVLTLHILYTVGMMVNSNLGEPQH